MLGRSGWGNVGLCSVVGAMQYVGKFVSSVYNTITPNINPSTLNGAIDVIVVEKEVEVEEEVKDEDGTVRVVRRRETVLAASPFHVRFGKMSVLRPGERKVTLHLNGSTEPLPFAMKVGEDGEAFFVMKIDDDADEVPASMVTSPILGPTTDVPAAAPKGPDLDPLDIGMSELAITGSPDATPSEATKARIAVENEAEYPSPFGAAGNDVAPADLGATHSTGESELHASKRGTWLR